MELISTIEIQTNHFERDLSYNERKEVALYLLNETYRLINKYNMKNDVTIQAKWGTGCVIEHIMVYANEIAGAASIAGAYKVVMDYDKIRANILLITKDLRTTSKKICGVSVWVVRCVTKKSIKSNRLKKLELVPIEGHDYQNEVTDEKDIILEIEEWIDITIERFSSKSKSCVNLYPELKDYYPLSFLSECSYVVTEDIPKPYVPLPKFESFLSMDVEGMTYKNLYFIKSGFEKDIALHLHELVHVAQWNQLGANEFIKRYMSEIEKYSYENAPLEKMAYEAQSLFEQNKPIANVPEWVSKKLMSR